MMRFLSSKRGKMLWIIIDLFFLVAFIGNLVHDIRRGAAGWSAVDALFITAMVYRWLPRDIRDYFLHDKIVVNTVMANTPENLIAADKFMFDAAEQAKADGNTVRWS